MQLCEDDARLFEPFTPTIHTYASQVYKTCSNVQSEADAKRMFERSAVFLMATLSIEVDRLEHIIRVAYPEFKYIDLEVL